jgi:hypothetical protein
MSGHLDHIALTLPLVVEVIHKHIPSLSDEDEASIYSTMTQILASTFDFDPSHKSPDVADLAVRTCRCGAPIADYYSYVDHLTALFGGESHYGG